MRRERRIAAGALALLVLLASLAPAPALAKRASEYEVKAAFLYNFARFVEWPADAINRAQGRFVIGVLGEDPFGPLLDETFADKTLLGMPVEVRRMRRITELESIHVLFVGAAQRPVLPSVLRRVEGSAVLTVGDTLDLAQNGTVIGFTLEENRVRFGVNQAAAQRAGLTLSSQLLKIATLVQER